MAAWLAHGGRRGAWVWVLFGAHLVRPWVRAGGAGVCAESRRRARRRWIAV